MGDIFWKMLDISILSLTLISFDENVLQFKFSTPTVIIYKQYLGVHPAIGLAQMRTVVTLFQEIPRWGWREVSPARIFCSGYFIRPLTLCCWSCGILWKGTICWGRSFFLQRRLVQAGSRLRSIRSSSASLFSRGQSAQIRPPRFFCAVDRVQSCTRTSRPCSWLCFHSHLWSPSLARILSAGEGDR